MKKLSHLVARLLLVAPGIVCITGGLLLGRAPVASATCMCHLVTGSWGMWSACANGICQNSRGTDSCDGGSGLQGYTCVNSGDVYTSATSNCDANNNCLGFGGSYILGSPAASYTCQAC